MGRIKEKTYSDYEGEKRNKCRTRGSEKVRAGLRSVLSRSGDKEEIVKNPRKYAK